MKLALQSFISILGRIPVIFNIVVAIMNSDKCANILFFNDFLDPICLKLAISKALGYGMMCAAFLYKVPIILKIFKVRGGDGLSPLGLYLETSSYLTLFVYNYLMKNPISTYGDLFPVIIQNIIIVLLLWAWGIEGKDLGLSHKSFVVAIGIGLTVSPFFLSSNYWSYLATYSIIVNTMSKLPQILSNFQNSNEGVQSWITVLNAVIGSTAKTFICWTETHDMYLVAGSLIATIFNLILLAQVLILSSSRTKKAKKE